jgi:hypothetical protein
MTDFNNVLGWMQSSAYFRDTPNGQPLVSTFSSGGGEWAEWNGKFYNFPNTLLYLLTSISLEDILGQWNVSDARYRRDHRILFRRRCVVVCFLLRYRPWDK